MQYKYKIPKLNSKSFSSWVSLKIISYSNNGVECLINTAASSPISSVHSPCPSSLDVFVSILTTCSSGVESIP
jgi:hypothetical protein